MRIIPGDSRSIGGGATRKNVEIAVLLIVAPAGSAAMVVQA